MIVYQVKKAVKQVACSKLLKYNVNLEKREFKEAGVQCYLDKELIIPLDVIILRILYLLEEEQEFSHFGFVKALEEKNLTAEY